MDAATADTVSQAIRTAGFDHTRKVTASGDTIVLEQRRYDGTELLTLLGVLVPQGTPIPGVSVSLEQSGLVIT